AIVGLVLLVIQIALGGWTSANYASQICNGVASLPICQGEWYRVLDFREALTFWGLEMPERGNFEFGHFSPEVRTTIHVMHRIGAIIVTGYLVWLGWRLRNAQNQLLEDLGTLMLLLLTAQVLLGLGNVLLGLPLLVATGHNAVAALLLLSLVAINFVLRIHKKPVHRKPQYKRRKRNYAK
ncbi:MAG: COX15/CtaA family protein, partial [Gammaproteobacteria bacterium]|nr:COX15/CtaA family protein [Gammaproteobacteria bacterium]NNJ72658.1 heme A synthase [Enterobacterales bacterium]